MTVQFSSFSTDDASAAGITILFPNGRVEGVLGTHPNYKKILSILLTTPLAEVDEAELLELVNPVLTVGKKLRKLSERFIYDNHTIFFDGDPIDSSLTKHIVKYIESGKKKSYKPLVKFMEKLYQNPSEESRKALYDYLVRYNLVITKDGDFLAYKGVQSNGNSFHSGYGIVDGVVYENSQLPNSVGAVVEIPRSRVDADNKVGCSTGLHAGTYSFASGYAINGGILFLVKINPRDVVSVPEDASFQKLRISRYVIEKKIKNEVKTPVYNAKPNHATNVKKNLSNGGPIPVNTATSTATSAATSSTVSANLSLIEKALKSGDYVDFSYKNARGEVKDVAEFMPTKIDHNWNGNLVTGEIAPDVFRSYYVERIIGSVTCECDFNCKDDEEDEPTLADSVDLDGFATFDYTKRDGTIVSVRSFSGESSDTNSAGAVLVHGKNRKGEARTYYANRVTNLVLPSDEVTDDTEDAPFAPVSASTVRLRVQPTSGGGLTIDVENAPAATGDKWADLTFDALNE